MTPDRRQICHQIVHPRNGLIDCRADVGLIGYRAKGKLVDSIPALTLHDRGRPGLLAAIADKADICSTVDEAVEWANELVMRINGVNDRA